MSSYRLPNSSGTVVLSFWSAGRQAYFCKRFVAASTLSAGAAQAEADQNQSVAEGVWYGTFQGGAAVI